MVFILQISVSFLQVLAYICYWFAGLSDFMLCSYRFGCWILSAHPLEYWRPSHHFSFYWKHGLATLDPSTRRGSHCILLLLFSFNLFLDPLFDQLKLLSCCFLVSSEKGLASSWRPLFLMGQQLVL